MSKSKSSNQPQDKEDLLFGLPKPQLDSVPDAIRPYCELGLKIQADTLELWSHRARAWMDWPETFTTCKTLDELTKAQGEYFGQMQRDYAHFAEGMLQRMMIERNTLDDQDSKVEEEPVAPQDTTVHKVAA